MFHESHQLVGVPLFKDKETNPKMYGICSRCFACTCHCGVILELPCEDRARFSPLTSMENGSKTNG